MIIFHRSSRAEWLTTTRIGSFLAEKLAEEVRTIVDQGRIADEIDFQNLSGVGMIDFSSFSEADWNVVKVAVKQVVMELQSSALESDDLAGAIAEFSDFFGSA